MRTAILYLACLILLIVAPGIRGQELPSPVPVVERGALRAEKISALAADSRRRKLYVGTLSRDPARSGLQVWELSASGQPAGPVRRFSDHPDPLPAGHHSTISCMLLDERHRKLFLGVQGSHPTHSRSLVMYSLDEQGWPLGPPAAFDHGNPRLACDALALHPQRNRLYAAGWGGEGVFLLERDDEGRPRGTPQWRKFGPHGGRCLAISPNGQYLYRGTYPSTIDVCQLAADGDLTADPPISRAVPGGPAEYQRFVSTDRGLYFVLPEQRLGWLPLDERGGIAGDVQTAPLPQLQAIAAGSQRDRLWIARGATYPDALTGQAITNGLELQEFTLSTSGIPGPAVRPATILPRVRVEEFVGGTATALAVQSLGHGFLGNRLAGLEVSCELQELETDGTVLPDVASFSLGTDKEYLRFAVSPRFGRVYASSGGQLWTCQPQRTSVVQPQAVPSPDAVGPVAVDDGRARVYVALRDGTLAVHPVTERGVPEPRIAVLSTGLQAVGALVVHPPSGRVLVLGQPRDDRPATAVAASVVPVPAGPHVAGATLDAERGRLYAVTAYHGQQNTALWELDSNGQLRAESLRWLPDAIPYRQPGARGVFTSVRLDTVRRQLLVTGNEEQASDGSAWIVVRELDEQGDPRGEPRRHASANRRGSCWSVLLSEDARTLWESGWGEATIHVQTSDARLTTSTPSASWSVGGQGKRQLEWLTVQDQSYLLAGTFPATLEVLPVGPDRRPEPAAMVQISADAWQRSCGLLGRHRPSPWFALDEVLRDKIGRSVLRCTLSGTTVRHAVVRWKLRQRVGDTVTLIREVDVPVAGNVAALIVPRYDLDDPGTLPAQVRTSAEEYREYRDWARQQAFASQERPRELLVANGLIGIDSSVEALEAGLETLALLGHNTAQIWNWPGIAPETIQTLARRHGITQFREAVYQPPAYFHYQVEQVRPAKLDAWSAGFRAAAARMGAAPHDLKLLHMADEPGWYFPGCLRDVEQHPERLAVFRGYLRDQGLTPSQVGASDWDQVYPGRQSARQTLEQKRLFFWTTRFYAESLSLAFAAASRSLEREVQPDILTTTNLNNWPGRFYLPSPGRKIANNTDAGPDAAMGMPDWFDLGRKRAVTCLWTEDWFGDADAQQWSLYGDLLRCAARQGGIQYGGYPVGHSMGAFPAGASYKLAALLGHGAKVVDPYIFGPHLAFGDGWSEKQSVYPGLAAALKLVGRAERLLAPGRPRDGTVALVFPQASQVWDNDASLSAYLQELYGLHAALIHENYPVDLLDDIALEKGELERRRYAAVYVTAPNLSLRAQRALRSWATAGGVLVLAPGACAADEYNEPLGELRDLLAVDQPPVPRVAPPHASQSLQLVREPLTLRDAQVGTATSHAVSQIVPLSPRTEAARVVATLSDGRPVLTSTPLGSGQLLACGFWPGVTYWHSPDRQDPQRLPTRWSDAARLVATWPARQARAERHVELSETGVEACLLESEKGWSVTLLNWSGQPKPQLTVRIPSVPAVRSANSAIHNQLEVTTRDDAVTLSLPLDTVDILSLER
ncbi:MAG: hypothetical protein U0935_24130 [Pirellulales bacterium]